jgi:Putative prokaryotic signal transducing protein
MKMIYTAENSAEAHLLAEALCQERIRASVHEDLPPERPSIWIDDETDWDRATELLTEMTAARSSTGAVAMPDRRPSSFIAGLLLGLVIGGIGAVVVTQFLRGDDTPGRQTWDLNGDGATDSWADYDPQGKIVQSSDDRNFDGRPDCWLTYDPPGVLSTMRCDQDFDGREDYWESYRNGAAVSYRADND